MCFSRFALPLLKKREMNKELIAKRLEILREEMRREHLSAFVFTTSDPHHSEYTAEHWKGREWISGFNGSAGTAVVTLKSAALWTDSRYFIAAEEQLKETEYQLMKLKMPETPTVAQWIGSELADMDDKTVGIDGMTNGVAEVENLKSQLKQLGGITLHTAWDPLQRIWKDRPTVPLCSVEIQPMEYAGEEAASKLKRIRKALREKHADGMLVASLDDIAWTLNLRGNDIHCCPLFVSFLLIDTQSTTLFIYKEKVGDEVKAYLAKLGVRMADYNQVKQGLKDYPEYNILMDPDEVCYTLRQAVTRPVVEAASPIPAMKAVKNEAEQNGFRLAMQRDGVALVKFLKWMEEQTIDGTMTELTVSDRLEQLRSEQPLYRGLSFDTISAYGPHGAIVHYEPTQKTDVPLQRNSLLLIDSGAQYQNGTTDITRTLALGELTEEERKVYTLVLKGHIQLQMLIFPKGASGTQLDAVARRDLWQHGYNFLHGTGHGVGSFLNVHEGPHQIRMEYVAQPLCEGMTVTDEPGIYLKDRFGVRIENTLLVVPAFQTECGTFLKFETLTLCPIDRRPIIREMMSEEEIDWLNQYHQMVYDRLAPILSEDEKTWLKTATKPL